MFSQFTLDGKQNKRVDVSGLILLEIGSVYRGGMLESNEAEG